jgi:hypothetical protein
VKRRLVDVNVARDVELLRVRVEAQLLGAERHRNRDRLGLFLSRRDAREAGRGGCDRGGDRASLQ